MLISHSKINTYISVGNFIKKEVSVRLCRAALLYLHPTPRHEMLISNHTKINAKQIFILYSNNKRNT